VEIKFRNRKLGKLANDHRRCLRELGQLCGTLFMTRLHNLSDAKTLEDLRLLPGNYHELTGDRKGQWACSLDSPYRLVFVPQEDPIPTSGDGRYIWAEILGVEIIEIVNYH